MAMVIMLGLPSSTGLNMIVVPIRYDAVRATGRGGYALRRVAERVTAPMLRYGKRRGRAREWPRGPVYSNTPMRSLARLLTAAIVVSVFAPVARPVVARAWFLYQLAGQEPAAELPNPLASRKTPQFIDSWGNPRAGGRRHEGIDILAPKDTPVLSTTTGLVTRVGTNTLGGQVVWILGPGLERHYYAHLNRYGSFRVGDRVQPGDVIGYAGDTGNARGGPVHLHYGIYRNGSARNPYPRLAAGAREAAARTAHPRPATAS